MLFENYGAIIHSTRNMPKQKADLIKTGSMYWIIQRNVLVRQKILDITSVIRSDGSKGCEIILDKDLIKVIPTPMRPFQGWRYYMDEDIPPDLNINDDGSEEIPDEINSELIKKRKFFSSFQTQFNNQNFSAIVVTVYRFLGPALKEC